MVFYKLQEHPSEDVHIYARKPQEIIELIRHYHETKLTTQSTSSTVPPVRLFHWVQQIPKLEDIVETPSGFLVFKDGKTSAGSEQDDEQMETLQVSADFSVMIAMHSVSKFDAVRETLPAMKRANLYKVQLRAGAFPSLYFIPEDVMHAIRNYDLRLLLEKAQIAKERERLLKKGHHVLV